MALVDPQGRSHIAAAPKIHMGLQEQALDLPALVILLLLDEMEGGSPSVRGSEPTFEIVKGTAGGAGVWGGSGGGHNITVLLP